MSAGQVDVVVDALRREAQTWDEESARLAAIADRAPSLEMSELQGGLFARVAGPCTQAAVHVAQRCTEGVAALADIADALRANADAYAERDAAVAERVAGAY